MPDRTIPYYNLIMKCSCYRHRNVELPDGFSIVSYQRGYEKEWAKLECSIGDFDTVVEAENYFKETYLQNSEWFDDILFALNMNHEVVGSCIAWYDMKGKKKVSSLHWLVVNEQYQEIGLGRALCVAVMNLYADRSDFPVFIHTQPWSWKAILLYLSLGFRLQKTDTFSHYENEYEKAMTEFERILSVKQYERLQQLSED